MKKYIITLVGCYSITSAVSSAALLLTFTETNGGVELELSGRVDVSNGSFDSDTTLPRGITNDLESGGFTIIESETNSELDIIEGIDLLGVNFVNASFSGNLVSGEGDFGIHNEYFSAIGHTDLNVLDDDLFNATITASDRVFLYSGQTFASMGLDIHARNTEIDLWAAHAAADDSEKVKFLVSGSAVPEPSSMVLASLGALGFLLRRRR